MKEVLVGLILWISQNTGLVYDHNAVLPEVKPVESRELAVLLFHGQIPASLSPSDFDKMIERVEAIYYPETKTIYVRNGLDLESVYGESALVHELVHFIQYQHGLDRNVSCVNALEYDAYRAQAVYLQQKGEEPSFDEFTVATRSICDARAESTTRIAKVPPAAPREAGST